MLKIRQQQFEIFQPVAEAAFVRRLSEYLKIKHAGVAVQLPKGITTVEQLPEKLLHEMVQNGIARGRAYGMRWRSTLSAFVTLLFVTAPNFDSHPLIERVLKDESTPPDNRIDQLWDRTTEQNWEAVKQNYDAGAWKISAKNGG
jgi:hypothetical protein